MPEELTLPQIGGSHTLAELEEIARRQAAAGLPPHADLDAAAKAAEPSPAPAAVPVLATQVPPTPVTDPGLVTLDGEE